MIRHSVVKVSEMNTVGRLTSNRFFAAAIAALVSCISCTGFGAITEINTDMTAQGDWEVTVAAGDSNIVTVAQSGSGRIVKKGAGTLVLTKNSTFSGGVEIQAGFLTVDPDETPDGDNVIDCTALGTGSVTILGQRSGYTGYCELGVVGALTPVNPRIVRIANAINITGTTNRQYPAIVFYGIEAVLSGKVTAAADFCFWEDQKSMSTMSGYVGAAGVNYLVGTFGEVESAGMIGYNGFNRFEFTGKVTAPTMHLNIRRVARPHEPSYNKGSSSKNTYYWTNRNPQGGVVFHVPSEIGEMTNGRKSVFSAVADALPGMLLDPLSADNGMYSKWFMRDYGETTYFDQSVGGLAGTVLGPGARYKTSSTASVAYDLYYAGGGGKTLTITGVDPDAGKSTKELVTSMSLRDESAAGGSMSVTLDAYAGFTQTFSNRDHTISGTLRAKKGTIKLGGATTFNNLSSLAVDAGAMMLVDTTNETAFAALSSLSVAGTLVFGENVAPGMMPTTLSSVSFSEGCVLQGLPAGTMFTCTTLMVDGQQLPAGRWTHDQNASIPEGITVTALSTPDPTASAEWTGAAASDNLMTTAGNWRDAAEAPDVTGGGLAVTIGLDGDAMEPPAGGAYVHSITSTRKWASADGTVTNTPFILGAKDAKLEVAKGVNFPDTTQVTLRGTIAPPFGVDQGDTALDNENAIVIQNHYFGKTMPAAEVPDWAVKGSGVSLPTVLDGATVEKPLFLDVGSYNSDIRHYGAGLLLAKAGTTNVIKGAFGWRYNWGHVDVGEGALLEFAGPVSATRRMQKNGAGTLKITSGSWSMGGGMLLQRGTLVLDAENIDFGCSSYYIGLYQPNIETANSSHIEFLRSWTLNDGPNGAARAQLNISGGGMGTRTVEFHSTTQRVTRFCGAARSAKSAMHGDYPAMLEISGGTVETAANMSIARIYNEMQVTGGLGFHYMGNGPSACASVLAGADDTFVISTNTNTGARMDYKSCGDLEVSGGTLEISVNATWRNGTNFTARGTGTFKLNERDAVNGKFAVLRLSDQGKIWLPEGVVQKFAAVYTNGVAVIGGRYTSLPNGDGDFIAGGGTIAVPPFGMVLIVK